MYIYCMSRFTKPAVACHSLRSLLHVSAFFRVPCWHADSLIFLAYSFSCNYLHLPRLLNARSHLTFCCCCMLSACECVRGLPVFLRCERPSVPPIRHWVASLVGDLRSPTPPTRRQATLHRCQQLAPTTVFPVCVAS